MRDLDQDLGISRACVISIRSMETFSSGENALWHTWRDLSGQYSCVVINGPRVDEHALGQLGNLSVKAWHQVVQCLQGQDSLESFSTK